MIVPEVAVSVSLHTFRRLVPVSSDARSLLTSCSKLSAVSSPTGSAIVTAQSHKKKLRVNKIASFNFMFVSLELLRVDDFCGAASHLNGFSPILYQRGVN